MVKILFIVGLFPSVSEETNYEVQDQPLENPL